MTELVTTSRKFRKAIPEAHRTSLDTRLAWLWRQKFGTLQMVWKESPDTLDHMAATMLLQAILAKDLTAISQVFTRLEGGALLDEELLAIEDERIKL